MIRHAYYIAEDDSLHGDKDLAVGLKELWKQLCTYDNIHLFEGVSRFTRELDERTHVITRFSVRHFFSEKPCISIFDRME